MYLNLVFKSLKADKNLDRVAAFTRRFVQLLTAGGGGGPEFTAGGLYVLGEVCARGLMQVLCCANWAYSCLVPSQDCGRR